MSRPLTSAELVKMALSGKYDGQIDVRHAVSQTQREQGIPVTDRQFLDPNVSFSSPADDPRYTQPPQQQRPPAPQIPGTQPFQPTHPSPQMMSLDEMMDVVNRRVDLATSPQIEAALRKLEEQQLSGEKRKGDVDAAYGQAKQDNVKSGMRDQQTGARAMSRRGIYDSGLAVDLAHRLASSISARGAKISDEQARVLADLGEYLDLQVRHTSEEIQGIMGQRADMAQSMLDEMHMSQQNRSDALAQQEFENWLRSEAHAVNVWGNQMNEYWREQEFDAGRADTEWQKEFEGRQAELQENQRSWERVYAMNRFEAEQELQRLMYNNEITQQEFQNALALDDFHLRVKLYEWQSL